MTLSSETLLDTKSVRQVTIQSLRTSEGSVSSERTACLLCIALSETVVLSESTALSGLVALSEKNASSGLAAGSDYPAYSE